jgi:CBS domain-containing protein
MARFNKPLFCLTAQDVMTPDPVVIPEDLPLREAAQRLVSARIQGVPVVDDSGRCVGVLSVTDFLRPEVRVVAAAGPAAAACSYQRTVRTAAGRERTACTLPFGVCPFQRTDREPDGREVTVCVQPQCACTEWQEVQMGRLPEEQVRHFMTPDPVLVTGDRPITEVARMMIDAHIHRVIVSDDRQRPLGVVSSTDLLAVLAYAQPEAVAAET